MDGFLEQLQRRTRRHFLRDCNVGLGGLALALLTGSAAGAESLTSVANPLAPRAPHFAPKAKRVIYLHLAGSPPHLDMYDYKPELVKHTGDPCPAELIRGKRFAFTSGVPKLLGTPHKFARYGQSGAWLSDAVPNLAPVVDELCFVKSMWTDQFNHAPAELMMFTGSSQFGRPGLGSWVTYGLGSESQNLPGFLVLVSSGTNPSAGKAPWGSGFLPSVFQGVQCRSEGDPVLYLSNPPGMDSTVRRWSLDALRELNQRQAAELGDPETLTRIAQYEMAFRMQVSAPSVMDISREPAVALEAYGAEPGKGSFANNCLLARRLVEQGVRFVQLHDWGWDFHGNGPDLEIKDALVKKSAKVFKPIAALIQDLKARGLLDETLVICGGEFGRTPFQEGRTAGQRLGRDHHPDSFTVFMAGGGVKPGITYGASDDLGYRVAEKAVHCHDLQATILHLLGFEHEKLSYRFQGRDYRLTDVEGKVVRDIVG